MTVLVVTGTRRGRSDTEWWLDAFKKRRGPIELVFVGDEPHGVDKQVRKWCEKNGVVCFAACAPWESVGRGAGPMRNGAMVTLVSMQFPNAVLLGLPDDESTGTHDCLNQARRLNESGKAKFEIHELKFRG